MVTPIAPTQSLSFAAASVGKSAAAAPTESTQSVPPPARSEPTTREANRPIRADFQQSAGSSGSSSNRTPPQQAAESYREVASTTSPRPETSPPPVDRTA